MATFNFSLQSVLEYRQSLVDRLRMEYAELTRNHQDAREVLMDLMGQERTALRALEGRRGQPLPVAELMRISDRLDTLALRIAEQAAVVDRLAVEAEALRQRIIETARDSKALEKLRDRQSEDFERSQRRAEQHDTDEIATGVFLVQRAAAR